MVAHRLIISILVNIARHLQILPSWGVKHDELGLLIAFDARNLRRKQESKVE